MNIRQLEIFTSVAETGSITKTAAQLYLSQPAISKTISELEMSLNVTLFDRIDNRLHLNPAGRAFRIQATQLLTDFNTLENFGAEQAIALPLRVGVSLTFGQHALPIAITDFRKTHPQTPLKLYAENVQQIKRRLLDGDIDLAFIEGFESSRSFVTEAISTYHLLLVGAPTLDVPETPLTKRQLLQIPFLLREPGSTLRDCFDERMHHLGLEIEPLLESINTEVLISAAQFGLGVTILPEPLARPYLEQNKLRVIKLAGAKMQTINYAIHLKNRPLNAAQQDMIDCFKRVEQID
ncbi:LysR family transcriptional regulator [Lapidilactobacillus mulanensis]|uniref:LysR family transcriptional regulator n=1 Tax=Lapidilactobacillus mulanensis TaxID=2485999 RepID=A0ABW4DP99_9LACO|nr:LysR family transcriptional regulator [Lapidilactobacillus mulanensis]